MLYSQLFLSYLVICHLQYIDCAPKIFAHLLKCNLQLEISAGRTSPAKRKCSEMPHIQSGVGFGGWQSGSFLVGHMVFIGRFREESELKWWIVVFVCIGTQEVLNIYSCLSTFRAQSSLQTTVKTRVSYSSFKQWEFLVHTGFRR